MQVALRMTSIKTRREVLALLTPEQRAKEKAEHEKMMQQHREGGRGHGSGMTNPHGGAMQGTPHQRCRADASRRHEDPVTHSVEQEEPMRAQA